MSGSAGPSSTHLPNHPSSFPAIRAQTLTSMSWAHQLASPFLLLSLYPCNPAPGQKYLFFRVSLGGTCTSKPSHPLSNPFPVGTIPGHSVLVGRAMPYLGQY